MTSISKKLYIDKLDDIPNKYNNSYRTIKIKPVDVKPNTYIHSSKKINDEDPKYKIGDIARISEQKYLHKRLHCELEWINVCNYKS